MAKNIAKQEGCGLPEVLVKVGDRTSGITDLTS